MAAERYWIKHPRSWLREPAFWREVTARALSALIAAAIIYLFAGLFGYVQTPSGRTVAVVLLLLALGGALGTVVSGRLMRNRGLRAILAFIAIAALVLLLDLAWVLFD